VAGCVCVCVLVYFNCWPSATWVCRVPLLCLQQRRTPPILASETKITLEFGVSDAALKRGGCYPERQESNIPFVDLCGPLQTDRDAWRNEEGTCRLWQRHAADESRHQFVSQNYARSQYAWHAHGRLTPPSKMQMEMRTKTPLKSFLIGFQ
jgi:hypothetical protein